MLWIKSFHVIFMVTWFSALFYLPRLYVYHALSNDQISQERFKLMERKLYFGIATPGAILTLLFGGWLFALNPVAYLHAPWFHAKVTCVVLLFIYHFYLGHIRIRFRNNQNIHRDRFYRLINEIPVLFLVAIVILVEVKPF